MAYETYTTEALVCGTKDRNTADRSYLLFTREAGMLFAVAKSVREERSRQRYALQDFSLIRVSLVKGKRDWRIGSVEAKKNFYHEASDKAARGSVTSMFRLLRRFMQGESPERQLFDDTVAALTELSQEVAHRSFVQLVCELRLLAVLGYVAEQKIPPSIRSIAAGEIASQYALELEQQLKDLFAHAIAVSHL